jgi:hypothetical protein
MFRRSGQRPWLVHGLLFYDPGIPQISWTTSEEGMPEVPLDDILRRVQGEFLEMPGLRLTEAQARRLWGLEAADCSTLLDTLVEANFLFKTPDGAFMRVEHAGPVKADVRRPSRIVAA